MLSKEEIKLIIHNSLLPKFESRISGVVDISQAKIFFENHVEILSDFVYNSQTDDESFVNIDLFKWLHKLLYPKDFKIIVCRNWIYYENIPWEWRLHDYNPQIPTSYWSKKEDIEKDLNNFIQSYNSIKEKNEEDILRFYFNFLRVHPFWDSNWTLASLICDLDLKWNWFNWFNILKIRFEDIKLFYYILTYHEQNIKSNNVLKEIISMIRDFQDWNLSDVLIEAKNKQEIYTTKKLF